MENPIKLENMANVLRQGYVYRKGEDCTKKKRFVPCLRSLFVSALLILPTATSTSIQKQTIQRVLIENNQKSPSNAFTGGAFQRSHGIKTVEVFTGRNSTKTIISNYVSDL